MEEENLELDELQHSDRTRLETFLVKDTVLDEFLQELSDGSGSFLTSVR